MDPIIHCKSMVVATNNTDMRELIALLGVSCWCFVIVVQLFLMVPWVSLQFVIVVFPDHTHYLWLRALVFTPWVTKHSQPHQINIRGPQVNAISMARKAI